MSVAIYFGKVNLLSSQINSVLDNTYSFRTILNNVLNALKDDITFLYSYTKNVDGQIIPAEIEYSLSIKEKNDSYLQGYIHKKSFLYYKDFDKTKKEIIPQKIENTESSEFYFDIFREMVGYQRTLRFGYVEFLTAFEGILNNACRLSNLNYIFNVNQYTEGLSLDELRNDLRQEPQIQKLKIRYQIPNPDGDILKQIQLNPEKTINDFKSANLSIKNVTYQSTSDTGLNIESELIQQELQNIDNIHSSINAKKATQNGYVEVESTNIHGITRSTSESHALTKQIDSIYDLKEEASKIILNYVRNSIVE